MIDSKALWFISVSIFFFLGPSRLFESGDVLFRSLSLINRSDRDLPLFKLPSGFSSRFSYHHSRLRLKTSDHEVIMSCWCLKLCS
ncbi:unnamed protein product [Brassica oleracea]